MASVCSRIHEWQDGHGKPGGRAEAARGEHSVVMRIDLSECRDAPRLGRLAGR
jgi:hypothetical protein